MRAIYDSLALNQRHSVDALMRADQGGVEAIHLVGGGVQATLLAQATAHATGATILAGPQEATVAGNMLCQLIAAGRIGGLEQGRAVVRRSFELATYRPGERSPWETAYAAFRALKGTCGQP